MPHHIIIQHKPHTHTPWYSSALKILTIEEAREEPDWQTPTAERDTTCEGDTMATLTKLSFVPDTRCIAGELELHLIICTDTRTTEMLFYMACTF